MENDKIRFWDAVVGMKLISTSMHAACVSMAVTFIPAKLIFRSFFRPLYLLSDKWRTRRLVSCNSNEYR